MMGFENELGPFQKYVGALPEPGIGSVIETGVIRNVIKNVDCVKYNDSFLIFIKKFESEIGANPDAILSALGAAITNMSLRKPGFDDVVHKLCKQYESFLLRSPICDMDIDININFIRNFLEVGIDIEIITSCLIAKLSSLEDEDEISDVRSVISNHYDVLERIYDIDDLECYAICLDKVIHKHFKQ